MQTIPPFDLYRELEVDPAASAATIEAAWKSLLKRLHPDVAGDATSSDRVKRLNLAREWLLDADKRARYDRARRRPAVIASPRATTVVSGPTAPPPMDARPDHNPYAEYDTQHPRVATPSAPVASSTAIRLRRPRYAKLLAPVAFAAVIILAAASSLIGSPHVPTAAAEASPSPAAAGSARPASTLSGASGAAVPARALPPPDLAAAIPASCRHPRYETALTFATQVQSAPALVAVVGCDNNRSYGPMLYVASNDTWELAGAVGLHDGAPVQGFSGPLTDPALDEFGIAWARDDGIHATVVLYRGAPTPDPFWDSSSIGLQWTLASFTYRSSADATAPGALVVVEADLDSGTAGCATCRDHQLYRDAYAWRSVAGRGQLVRITRELAGIGPP